MKSFNVTSNEIVTHNLRWAINVTFNPNAGKPSKHMIAKKVLNSVGRSGISSVEVNEDFVVNIYREQRLSACLKFKRLDNSYGDNSSALQVMVVQSLDFNVVWEFTNTQIMASAIKGTDEAVGKFVGTVSRVLHIDDIAENINSVKTQWRTQKEKYEAWKKDPLGTEEFFKD